MAVGTLDKWLLAHFAVRDIARKGQMIVGTWDKWLLGHLVVRKIARRSQMAVGTFIKAFLTFLEALELFRHYFQVNSMFKAKKITAKCPDRQMSQPPNVPTAIWPIL